MKIIISLLALIFIFACTEENTIINNYNGSGLMTPEGSWAVDGIWVKSVYDDKDVYYSVDTLFSASDNISFHWGYEYKDNYDADFIFSNSDTTMVMPNNIHYNFIRYYGNNRIYNSFKFFDLDIDYESMVDKGSVYFGVEIGLINKAESKMVPTDIDYDNSIVKFNFTDTFEDFHSYTFTSYRFYGTGKRIK